MRFFFNPISGTINAGPSQEIVYADTAPQYPQEGSRWFDTINLREYVYTGTEWVESGVGPAGVKGDTGDKGDRGDVGPIGPVGPQGPAATIAVGAVTTGVAGTNASVSNSGTSGAAVFNFTIPRGEKGDIGNIGPQGPQGIQGVKGDDGASISLKGAVATPASLTSIAVKTQGDLYVAQSDGNGYVWDGSTWVDVGQIRGPKGDTGAQGPAGPAPAGTGVVVVSNGVTGTPVGYGTTNTANTLVQRDASGNFSAGVITGNLTGSVTGGVIGNVTGNASTASKLATAQTINVSGDVTGTAQSFDGSAAITIPTAISAGVIVNADINSAAAISDTKLATISTAGKVSNSATTATSANTANAIVARDSNGNFSATTITAALSGNATSASSAAKLTTARSINGVSFDGSADITISAAPTAHYHNASDITAGTLANAQLPARLQAAAQTITDWNNALENGWYRGYQTANAPEGVLDWWLGYVEVHYDRWVTQTVHRFTADAPTNTHIWRRSSWDDGGGRSWQSWYKLQLSQSEQDTRYALSGHTHGNITNAGAIGTTASLPIITGASGVLQAGSFGTTAGTFCQGNDARLSDARTPTSHTHDDRYYTETEVNTLLADKSATSHTHDDRYYTETEVNTLLAGKSATTHTHDDRYYTETEVNTLLAGKSATTHTHTSVATTFEITNSHSAGVTNGYTTIAKFNPTAVDTTSTTGYKGGNVEFLNGITAGKCDGVIGPGEPVIKAIWTDGDYVYISGQDPTGSDGKISTNYVFAAKSTFTGTSLVYSGIRADGYIYSRPLDGSATRSLYANASGLITTSSSDERLKENISTIDSALAKVGDLRGVYYNWKNKEEMGTAKCIGLIAQEVQKVIPEATYQNNDGYYGVHYAELVSVLINAVNELKQEVDELRAQVNA